MSEAQIKFIGVVLAVLALVCIGAAGAGMWQANAYGKVIATNEASRQADLTLIANAGAEQARNALYKQQKAELALAELDTKRTQERDKLNEENEDLLRTVADGSRRLRIAGSCRPSGSNLPGTASSPGVGDEGAVELSAATGRSVLDICAGIIADRAALKAAEDYIKDICR